MMFMKIAALILSSIVSLGACADEKVIDGVRYETYGMFNDEKRNPNIQYEVSWGNVFWGWIGIGTLIMPLYFFGFSIKEPICKKSDIVGEACKQ